MHVKDFSPLRFTLAYKSIWLRPLSNPIYFCVKRLDFKKYKALISLLLTSKLLTWQSGLGVMQICSMTFALCVKLNKKNVLCSVLLPTHIRYADFWCILKHGREKLRSLIWQWKNKNKPVKSCRTEIGIWPIISSFVLSGTWWIAVKQILGWGRWGRSRTAMPLDVCSVWSLSRRCYSTVPVSDCFVIVANSTDLW